MKSIYEIVHEKEIREFEHFTETKYNGIIRFKGDDRIFIFIMSVDENGDDRWEHVSVHINGQTKKTPSWDDMCKIKDLFWNSDEEVHQIHPPKKYYVHSFNELENVLHLWRPVGGWKE